MHYAEDSRFDWYVLKDQIDFTRLKLPVAIVGEGVWQGVDDPLWSRTGWVDVIPLGWPEEVQAAHSSVDGASV